MDNKLSLSEKIFSKPGYKFLLFLVSYILAVVVLFLIIAILERDAGFLEYFFVGLLLFPVGLFRFIPGLISDLGDSLYVYGWAIYILITLVAVFVKNNRTAKTLYIIFVILLIINIGGCLSG